MGQEAQLIDARRDEAYGIKLKKIARIAMRMAEKEKSWRKLPKTTKTFFFWEQGGIV